MTTGLDTGTGLALALAALLGMEGVATLTHRYVMHGWMWRWHASHHAPRRGLFEVNDLFAIVFAAVSVGLIYWGAETRSAPYWLGWGMVGYGAIYALFHDGLVHGRIPLPPALKRVPYLRHLVRAHYLHHATHRQHGAVSYGFMYAKPLARLRADFKDNTRDAARARAPAPAQSADRP